MFVGVGALRHLGDVILVGLVGVVTRPRNGVVGEGKVASMGTPVPAPHNVVLMCCSGGSRMGSQVGVVVRIVGRQVCILRPYDVISVMCVVGVPVDRRRVQMMAAPVVFAAIFAVVPIVAARLIPRRGWMVGMKMVMVEQRVNPMVEWVS